STRRAIARTAWPLSRNSRTTLAPRWPVAPVTATRIPAPRSENEWDQSFAVGRVVGELAPVPAVMRPGARAEIGGRPDRECRCREVPAGEREAAPLDDLSQMVRAGYPAEKPAMR